MLKQPAVQYAVPCFLYPLHCTDCTYVDVLLCYTYINIKNQFTSPHTDTDTDSYIHRRGRFSDCAPHRIPFVSFSVECIATAKWRTVALYCTLHALCYLLLLYICRPFQCINAIVSECCTSTIKCSSQLHVSCIIHIHSTDIIYMPTTSDIFCFDHWCVDAGHAEGCEAFTCVTDTTTSAYHIYNPCLAAVFHKCVYIFLFYSCAPSVSPELVFRWCCSISVCCCCFCC